MRRKAVLIAATLTASLVGAFAGVDLSRASRPVACEAESGRALTPVAAARHGGGIPAVVGGRSLVVVDGEGRRETFLPRVAGSGRGSRRRAATGVRHRVRPGSSGTRRRGHRDRSRRAPARPAGRGVGIRPGRRTAGWCGRSARVCGSGRPRHRPRSTSRLLRGRSACSRRCSRRTTPSSRWWPSPSRASREPRTRASTTSGATICGPAAGRASPRSTPRGEHWVAIRTPIVRDDGSVEFVLVRGLATATRMPAFELWRMPAGGVASKVRDLPREMYLAGTQDGRRIWNLYDQSSGEWRLYAEASATTLVDLGCGAALVDPRSVPDPDMTPAWLDTVPTPTPAPTPTPTPTLGAHACHRHRRPRRRRPQRPRRSRRSAPLPQTASSPGSSWETSRPRRMRTRRWRTSTRRSTRRRRWRS